MKKNILIIISIFCFSCQPKSEFKKIDFETFEITVPENWNEIELNGTDSYIGGIITAENDTLIFDIGAYSPDVSKNDLPLVYDKNSYAELTEKQKKLLKNTKHLVVDTISGKINFKNYLTQKFEIIKVDCFKAKIITTRNKGFGTTGIYFDSLEGDGRSSNKTKFSFYGENLKEKTEKDFLKALKTIKLTKYCH